MVQKGVREDLRTDRHYECEKARNTMLNDVRKRMGQEIKGIPGPDNDDMARLEDIVQKDGEHLLYIINVGAYICLLHFDY